MEKNTVRLFSSQMDFATFGKNAIAYVRPVNSDDMNARFPEKAELPEGLDLWGLFHADGTPLAVSDERASLFDNAEELDLMAVETQ
ncbi:MAG: DUF1150 family protein [Pseudomonadota bacterium]